MVNEFDSMKLYVGDVKRILFLFMLYFVYFIFDYFDRLLMEVDVIGS